MKAKENFCATYRVPAESRKMVAGMSIGFTGMERKIAVDGSVIGDISPTEENSDTIEFSFNVCN